MFKEIADIKTSDQLKLPVPEQDVLLVVLEKFMRKCVNSRKIVKMLM